MLISAGSYLLLLFTAACLTPSIVLPAAGFSIKLIPIDSPESPLFSAGSTAQERRQQLARISTARARRYSNKDGKGWVGRFESPVQGGVSSQFYYSTQLNLGTDAGSLSPHMLVDTGSPETWVQCEGCTTCFAVKGGNFDYKKSPSYRLLAYNTEVCQIRYQNGDTCGYTASYPRRQMRSTGVVGIDTIFFGDPTGQSGEFFEIAFGCGLQNDDVHFGNDESNVIAGVFGLGPGGPRAFTTQVKKSTKGKFTYCLPLPGEVGKSTTLLFGREAKLTGKDVQKMPMRSEVGYHAFLEGISVNATRVPIDPNTFEYREDGSQGFYMDSGSPYSVLTAAAYNPLSDAVAEYFSRLGIQPREDDSPPFDLCFSSIVGAESLFPTLTLHFRENFTLSIPPENVFVRLAGGGGFCMGILWAPDPGPSIFGAMQQANYQFVFDLLFHEISFVRRYNGC